MAAAKLTKRFVDGIRATGSEQVYFDSELPGFYIRVSADATTKSYGIKFRNRGHVQRRMKIAVHGVVTPDQARAMAAKMLAENAQGADPAAQAKAYREAWTVADLAKFFRDEVLPTKRASTRGAYASQIDRFIVPLLGRRKVKEVTTADVTQFHRKVSASGQTQANRVVRCLSSMFTSAIREGHVAANPCAGVRKHPEHKRERYLTADELGRLLVACDQYHDEQAANYVRLVAFTGTRRMEALTARWDMFDLDRMVWTMPSHHTKQNRTHVVPLTPSAVALLTAMRDAADQADDARSACPWLFPKRDLSGPRADVKHAWANLIRAAGLESQGVTLHTLRHTFASHVVQSGASLPMVGSLLGHTQAATTHRYAHLAVDPLRDVAAAIDRAAQAGRKKALEQQQQHAAKVVNIAKARRK